MIPESPIKQVNGTRNEHPKDGEEADASQPLSKELLQKMNAYWRAANYLSVGQIYLYDNPLLKEPLKLSHVKGTITTPFDRRVQNEIDRFHLVQDVIDSMPHIGPKDDYLKQIIREKLIEHKHYIDKHGQDMPEILHWKWGNAL